MIQLYRTELSAVMADPTLYRQLYETASPERKEKADRYRHEADKLRCLISYELLRQALSDIGHSISEITVTTNTYGKPYIKELPDFHFNIAHSGNWVVLASSTRPVGIDVECIDPKRSIEALAKRYFSDTEQAYINSAPKDQPLRFCQLWTAKESYLKYKGFGFAQGTVTPDLTQDGEIEKGVYLRRFSPDATHCIALCSEENPTTFPVP